MIIQVGEISETSSNIVKVSNQMGINFNEINATNEKMNPPFGGYMLIQRKNIQSLRVASKRSLCYTNAAISETLALKTTFY